MLWKHRARHYRVRCTNLPRWAGAEKSGREAALTEKQKENQWLPWVDSRCQENKTKTEVTLGQQWNILDDLRWSGCRMWWERNQVKWAKQCVRRKKVDTETKGTCRKTKSRGIVRGTAFPTALYGTPELSVPNDTEAGWLQFILTQLHCGDL